MKGLQVVNGCQTVSTLVKAEADGLLCDDVYVNTKFLAKTNENDFIQSVINFTNTQNAITERDLHSNDQIQYDIQSILKNAGYLYERKLNEYKNDDSELRIDALEAAQAYLCCALLEPHTAKQKKNKLFRELYSRVFDEAVVDLPYKLWVSVKILEYAKLKSAENRLRKAETRRKGKKPRYHFKDLVIANGSFHIAALIYKKHFMKKTAIELKKMVGNKNADFQITDQQYEATVQKIEMNLKLRGIDKIKMVNHFKTEGIVNL